MSCCCDDGNFDPEPEGIVVQDDGVTIVAEATTLDFVGTGWVVTDAGGGVAQIALTRQVFRYVAVGGEVAPLTINLPAPRASVNYNVSLTMARTANGGTAFKDVWPLTGTFGLASFDVEPAVALELGDVLLFIVEDLT